MRTWRWQGAVLISAALSIVALATAAAAATSKADTNPAGATCAIAMQASACAPDQRSPAPHSVKVAIGYCNERCHRQAEICRYRNETREHCASRLAHCLANC